MICDICSSPEPKFYYQKKTYKYYVCKNTQCYLKMQVNLGNGRNMEGWTHIQNQLEKCLTISSGILAKPLHIFAEDLTEFNQLHYLNIKIFDSFIIQIRKNKFENKSATIDSNLSSLQVFGCFESLALTTQQNNFKSDIFPQLYFFADASQPDIMSLIIFPNKNEVNLQVWYWHKELKQNDEQFDLATFIKKQQEQELLNQKLQKLAIKMNLELKKKEERFLISFTQPFYVIAQNLIRKTSFEEIIDNLINQKEVQPLIKEEINELENEIQLSKQIKLKKICLFFEFLFNNSKEFLKKHSLCIFIYQFYQKYWFYKEKYSVKKVSLQKQTISINNIIFLHSLNKFSNISQIISL